jgi:hypothetical protein
VEGLDQDAIDPDMLEDLPKRRLYAPPALAVDPRVYEHVEGVVALYYTGQLQFIPVPFATHDFEPVCSVLPRTIDPFDPNDWARSRSST